MTRFFRSATAAGGRASQGSRFVFSVPTARGAAFHQGAGFVFSGPSTRGRRPRIARVSLRFFSPDRHGQAALHQGAGFVFSGPSPAAGRPRIARVRFVFSRPTATGSVPTRALDSYENTNAPLWNQSVARPACSWTRAFDARPFSSSWVYGPPLMDGSFFQVPSPARML
jgi:hypothetical protein